MSQSLGRMKVTLAKIAELREQCQQQSRIAFREGAQELFEAHPELQEFAWTQYTPYFCDGEECLFGVLSDDPDINGVGAYDESDRYNEKLGRLVTAFIEHFSDDDMEDMFGDHVRVTIRRGKTEADVEEWDDHD